MMKSLFDRLAYAFIGFVFGALASVLMWIFLHAGRMGASYGKVFDPALRGWIEVVGGVFAVIGFVAKDGVGSAIGGSLDATWKGADPHARSGPEVPRWVLVPGVLVAAAGAAFWYVAHR